MNDHVALHAARPIEGIFSFLETGEPQPAGIAINTPVLVAFQADLQ
jgi:hypothetical protein